ncbi:ser/Thr protein phosphatase [Hirsutella rhossiliensis]|uniref:Ser/Thr protein phosphatase n=1 Tax=Hirsutella rhossiliensis TaxID=111463 RepID=A0A9P8MWV1_9HYPO|nr:ser/Thr protein phosphatase [Hirsutella rhossiliensis]KAH0962700.1 ser/Thr protein phosphatase [Hirsutella rhossiliensis]
MIQARLNDAAIALHRALDTAHIIFGIFGGYAIGALGGVRESKDVDCLASVSKDEIVEILDGKAGFQAIPQSRQDYVAFFWSDKTDRNNAVLVEIFCEKFPGSRYMMGNVPRRALVIEGLSLGRDLSYFLDPFYLFKGKLRAAATRAKFHDPADLRMLAGKYENVIKPRAHELDHGYAGLALKRYVELERLFDRLGVDVQRAKDVVKNCDLDKLPAPTLGDVQRGILG